VRSEPMWSARIEASANLPCESSVRGQRAWGRSVLARRLRPRSARLGDLGEVVDCAGALERPGDEVRAGARLERDMDLMARKAPDPSDAPPVGHDPAGRDLTGVRVERVEGDLGAMDAEACHDDAREDLLQLRPSTELLVERTQVPRFMLSMGRDPRLLRR
jgi:hypothetical protein